ncbi:MAG: histidine phosphatase family protein [Verrucomicrobiota bacterium]|nr:histidine phosphatase family protein [Verrucomicrobiota bacterium]
MEQLTRLYLIRHGEVEEKYHKVFGGARIDMELSPLGHEQVRALANYLLPMPPDLIYASPMRRVQQTLEPLAQALELMPVILPDLREVDFGSWTGLSWEQVLEKFQISAYTWLDQLEDGTIPQAETTVAFRERVANAINTILNESSGKSIAVVCHGGVIRMILSILFDLPFRRMNLFEVEYASITRVLLRPTRVELELHNFTPWRDLRPAPHL